MRVEELPHYDMRLEQTLKTADGMEHKLDTIIIDRSRYILRATIQSHGPERVWLLDPDAPLDVETSERLGGGGVAFRALLCDDDGRAEDDQELGGFTLDMHEATWLMACVEIGRRWFEINRPRVIQ